LPIVANDPVRATGKNHPFLAVADIAYTGPMKWTLVVPGALLPAVLAPDILGAAQAPRLSERLARAQAGTEFRATESAVGSPHWSWLARSFGIDAERPVTAPYAWRALSGGLPAAPGSWIAFCDPVHMAVAHDHVIVSDFEEAPLRAEELDGLLTLANEALRGEVFDRTAPPGRASALRDLGLRIQALSGHWFLLADAPMDLQAPLLDAVLGQAVQERLPSGTDAGAWRALANEIQMLWHTSAINVARERFGAQPVNAVWVHGGGQWEPLSFSRITQLLLEEELIDSAVLRGWLLASGGNGAIASEPAGARQSGGDTLSVCRTFSRPFAYQDWRSWLERLPLFEERLERELAAARGQGAAQFEIVLCGVQTVRTLVLPRHAPWWRWRARGLRASPALLRRWFAEADSSPTLGAGRA